MITVFRHQADEDKKKSNVLTSIEKLVQHLRE